MNLEKEFELVNHSLVKTVTQQHDVFVKHIPKLQQTIDSYFLGEHRVTRAQDMAHLLSGIACKHLFRSILLLTFNGYVAGASSLLRTMAEHTINAAYLLRNPDEVDDFVDWSYIREFKVANSTISLDEPWSREYAQSEYYKELTKRHSRVKERFKGRKDWCKKGLRDRANECGLLKLYKFLHLPFSSAVHGDIVGLAISIERKPKEDTGIITEWGPSIKNVDRTLHGVHICVLAALSVANDALELDRKVETDDLFETYWEIWGGKPESANTQMTK